MSFFWNPVTLLIFLTSISSSIAHASAVPEEVRKSVAFVYVQDPKTGVTHPNGTGFFVGVRVPNDPNRGWIYVVTNKHVVTDPTTRAWYPSIQLRVNTHTQSKFLSIPLYGEPFDVRQDLFPSHDPAVDLVLIAFPFSNELDHLILPVQDLIASASPDGPQVAPGTDLYFTGMFVSYLGGQKIEPMVRFGRVSMIPQEKVLFNGYNEDLILAEVFSFGGNSGSPVFYFWGLDQMPGAVSIGPPLVKLAGVMQGFFPGNETPYAEVPRIGEETDVSPEQSPKNTKSPPRPVPVFLPNSGIAAIIPAQKILDILDYPEVKLRQR